MSRFLLIALLVLTTASAAAEIVDRPEQVRPLLPGQVVPAFELKSVSGKAVQVDPATFEKPVVLTFYRGGWCPYCNLHLAELRHAEEELRQMEFDVWFVSPDRPELLAEGQDAAEGYELYSDTDAAAARLFGVAFRLDDDTHADYQGFGVDITERAGTEHRALPVASTFLIGTDGTVQFSFANPDYTVRLHPNVLLAVAEAYREKSHERLRRQRRQD